MSQEARDPLSDPEVRALVEKMAQLRFGPHGATTDVEGISDCLEALFAKLGTEDVGELVASAIASGLLTQAQGGASLVIAAWSGRTNGGQLRPTIERWLEEGQDPIRVGLALAQDTFPFSDLERMTQVLSRIASRHPQYAAACRGLIARRQQQGV